MRPRTAVCRLPGQFQSHGGLVETRLDLGFTKILMNFLQMESTCNQNTITQEVLLYAEEMQLDLEKQVSYCNIQVKDAAPGPGNYDVRDSLNARGSYFLQKYRSTQTRSFGRAQRSVGRRSSTSISNIFSCSDPWSWKLQTSF